MFKILRVTIKFTSTFSENLSIILFWGYHHDPFISSNSHTTRNLSQNCEFSLCTYLHIHFRDKVVEILSIISLDPSHLGCRIVVDTISEFFVASSNIDELSSMRRFFLEVQVLELHLIICNSLRDSIPLSWVTRVPELSSET